jgi:hypothetical protein
MPTKGHMITRTIGRAIGLFLAPTTFKFNKQLNIIFLQYDNILVGCDLDLMNSLSDIL